MRSEILTDLKKNEIERSKVKLGNKELLIKEQTGFEELFSDYQPFYTIILLLDKELLTV